MPRKSLGGEGQSPIVSFRLDEKTLHRIKTISKNTGKSMSEIMREALDQYIEKNEELRKYLEGIE